MNLNHKTPVYSSVEHGANVTSNLGSSRPKSKKRRHDYRPIPLRFPFLFSFVTLSAIYIILIEVLLHHAEIIPTKAAESTTLSQRLFARQTTSRLSTSYVTVTAYVTMPGATVTVTGIDYTTIHTTGSGTAASTVTLSPTPVPISSAASKTSTVSTTSGITTTSRATLTTTPAAVPSIVTSGTTSYYVSTVTITSTVTVPAVTVSLKQLQTVLIFDKPSSSAPLAPAPQSSQPPTSAAPTESPPSSSVSSAPPVSASSVSQGLDYGSTMTPTTTKATTLVSILAPSQALYPSSTSSSRTTTLPPATSVLPSSLALSFTSSPTIGSSTASYSTTRNLPSSSALTFVLPSSSVLTNMLPSSSILTNIQPSVSISSSVSDPVISPTLTPVLPSSSALIFVKPSELPDPSASSASRSDESSTISDGQVQAPSSKISTFLAISSLSAIFVPSSSFSIASTPSSISGPVYITITVAANSTASSLNWANLTSPTTSVMSSTNSSSSSTRSTSISSFITSSSTAAASATSTPAAVSEPKFILAPSERLVQGDFNMGYYVSSLYIPALLAIILKGLWEIVYASTRLMQPFERMATPKGVSGRYSVFAQYLSSSLSFDVARAISHGNPIPLLAELSYILVQVGTPIAAISTTVRPRSYCNIGDVRMPCDPVWILDVPLLRVIEGILAVCLLCVIAILSVRARHRSGVDTDPSSLGSIATITNEENLIRSMQAYSIDSQPMLFEQMLRKRHFRLTDYSDSRAVPRYGIVTQKGPVMPPNLNSTQGQPGYHTITEQGAPLSDDPMLVSTSRAPLLSPAREAFLLDLLGLLTPLTLLIMILAFWLDGNLDDTWNRFFLSGSVWPKLLLVGLATVSSLLVTNIERIVRSTEPFRRLSTNARTERSAPPATTLLISRSGTAYSTLMQCFMLLIRYEHRGGRMIFQSLVAFTVIVSDLNIVAVAGIAWTQATTQASFQLSMIISMAFTGFVILVWLIIIFWWRRHHAVRELRASSGAATVAGTMRYISCGSEKIAAEVARMYEEWHHLGSRSRMGRQWFGYRAVFGQYPCSDGKVRWCVALQKLAEEIDEIPDAGQDAGPYDSRLKYY